jgi:trimeric autotransporter adhesin
MNTVHRISNRRGVASRAKMLLGAGVGSAMLLAGVAFVGVLPASAAVTLTFANVPTTSTANVVISPAITVTVGGTGGATDSITLSSPCSFSSGSTLTATAVSNVATFNNVAINTGPSCVLTATDNTTAATQASSSIAITPGTVNKLGFTTAPPTTAGVGVALATFRVSAEDQWGNPETTGTDTIGLTSSCTLGGTVSTPEVAGVATFSTVTINQVGSCILIASDTTNTAITAVPSSAITVSGGTPAKLAFNVAPPTTVATTGTVVTTFKVAVEDASGNIDTTGLGATDQVSIASPCLAAPVVATAAAGIATFATVEFATTGACVLTATDTTRVIAAATASVQVGTPQAAIVFSSTSGYLDAPLTLATTGGSGTGAVTFTVTNGTATGCVITAGVLSATTGGTCLVTATKAAVAPYATATATATITISSAPKAIHLAGVITRHKVSHVTISGYNFSGRPKAISNVAGFKATVTRDSGKSLSLTITVTGSSKPGVKVLSLTFANGKHASVKYSLH